MLLRGEQDLTVTFSSFFVIPSRSVTSLLPVSSWEDPEIFFKAFIPRRFRNRFFLTLLLSLITLFVSRPELATPAAPGVCAISSETLIMLCVRTIGVLCLVYKRITMD